MMDCFNPETSPDDAQGIECIRCVDCGERFLEERDGPREEVKRGLGR